MRFIAGAIAGVIMCIVTALVVSVVAAALAIMLTPLILVAWNIGVVSVAAAAGGSVGALGFWGAYGLSMCLVALRGVPMVGGALVNALKMLAANTPATTEAPTTETREQMVERLRNTYGVR